MQCLSERFTKTWGGNGLDVKLLSISRKTTKARVANHNDSDAKLLRSSWKTTKAWVANHNGSDAKLLRMSLKIQEKKKLLFLLFFKSSLVACERILSSFAAKPIRNATLCLVAFEHILSSFGAKPTGFAFRWDNPFAYAADHSSRPTYVCLPSGLYHAQRSNPAAIRTQSRGNAPARHLLLWWLKYDPAWIANLTLLPREKCGYAHANMAPFPRNQRCHSQKPVLLPFLV